MVELGQTFGYLIVLERAGTQRKGKQSRALWRCRCICGKEKVAVGVSLRQGQTTSCGCKGLVKGGSGLNRLFISYRVRAKKRKIFWGLTKRNFETTTSQDCFYCGAPPKMTFTSTGLKGQPENEWSTYKYNGLDRVDNTKGYKLDNVVAACAQCNKAKQDRSATEFLDWVVSLYQRFTEGKLGYSLSKQEDIFRGKTLYGTTKGHAGFAKVYGAYRGRAKKSGRKWSLTKEQVWCITSSTCYYCGIEPTLISKPTSRKQRRCVDWGTYYYNGIDRVDNTGGYTIENVVPCCVYCNKGKLNNSVEDFRTWIRLIVLNKEKKNED